MAISFNTIPSDIRTPNAFVEIDNSRALKGLAANPHKALLIGQKIAAGSASVEVVKEITRANLADGFFGPGSELARMCNVFKEANPNTELHAIAISAAGGVLASGTIAFSTNMSITTAGTWNLMFNGKQIPVELEALWSVADVGSAVVAKVNGLTYSQLPMVLSTNAASDILVTAVLSGEAGNYLDFRDNFFAGQSRPAGLVLSTASFVGMAGGTTNPDLGDVWTVIENTQYQYICQPYVDATNLTEIEGELSDRFGPMIEKQGHGFVGVQATVASATTIGNSRNSPHNTIIALYDSPTDPMELGAVLCAVAAKNLNNDPARPLHFLQLPNIVAPPVASRFTQAERNILLFDGVATFIVDTGGNVLIERCITTYQSNALGLPDWSYLDIQTLATLSEIRYQFLVRMTNRFIIPRFKLADDTFPVQAGQKIATPRTIKYEIVALFTQLRNEGLIENLDDFVDNLIVERDVSDRNRVNTLLPPDMINQFRVLAGQIQFIL